MTVDGSIALEPAVSLLNTLMSEGVVPTTVALSSFAVGGNAAWILTVTVAALDRTPPLPVTVYVNESVPVYEAAGV